MRLIGDYISYIKDIRRYSARTQAIYSDALKVFVEDCGAATDEELLKSLTPQIIRSHEVYLLEKERIARGRSGCICRCCRGSAAT